METRHARNHRQRAFTRVDAAAIVAIVSVMALLALPALAINKSTTTGIQCVETLGKMTLAWQLYAADNSGKVVNNFGIWETWTTVSNSTFLNWNHNVMDWTIAPSNTNEALMTSSKIYPYLSDTNNPFKCPADSFRSPAQTKAGWTNGRLRSYSMNGYMGAFTPMTNDSTYTGRSWVSSGDRRQFMQTASIPRPERTVVFLEEHPDSINDGLFVNTPSQGTWGDLPGSHHNGAGGFSFADGHAEMHSWLVPSTTQPIRFRYQDISISQRQDFNWVHEQMTVRHETLAVTRTRNEAKITWTPTTSTYVLQSSTRLNETNWTSGPEPAVKEVGQVSVRVSTGIGARFFRLARP